MKKNIVIILCLLMAVCGQESLSADQEFIPAYIDDPAAYYGNTIVREGGELKVLYYRDKDVRLMSFNDDFDTALTGTNIPYFRNPDTLIQKYAGSPGSVDRFLRMEKKIAITSNRIMYFQPVPEGTRVRVWEKTGPTTLVDKPFRTEYRMFGQTGFLEDKDTLLPGLTVNDTKVIGDSIYFAGSRLEESGERYAVIHKEVQWGSNFSYKTLFPTSEKDTIHGEIKSFFNTWDLKDYGVVFSGLVQSLSKCSSIESLFLPPYSSGGLFIEYKDDKHHTVWGNLHTSTQAFYFPIDAIQHYSVGVKDDYLSGSPSIVFTKWKNSYAIQSSSYALPYDPTYLHFNMNLSAVYKEGDDFYIAGTIQAYRRHTTFLEPENTRRVRWPFTAKILNPFN